MKNGLLIGCHQDLKLADLNYIYKILIIFSKNTMKIIKTKFKDLFLVKGETHADNRGFFRELVYQK